MPWNIVLHTDTHWDQIIDLRFFIKYPVFALALKVKEIKADVRDRVFA